MISHIRFIKYTLALLFTLIVTDVLSTGGGRKNQVDNNSFFFFLFFSLLWQLYTISFPGVFIFKKISLAKNYLNLAIWDNSSRRQINMSLFLLRILATVIVLKQNSTFVLVNVYCRMSLLPWELTINLSLLLLNDMIMLHSV